MAVDDSRLCGFSYLLAGQSVLDRNDNKSRLGRVLSVYGPVLARAGDVCSLVQNEEASIVCVCRGIIPRCRGISGILF